jgi:hypothetical protein
MNITIRQVASDTFTVFEVAPRGGRGDAVVAWSDGIFAFRADAERAVLNRFHTVNRGLTGTLTIRYENL